MRRLHIVAFVAALTVGGVLGYIWTTTPLYDASVEILIDPRQRQTVESEITPTGLGSSAAGADTLLLESQVEVLTKGGPLGTTNTLVRYIFVSGFREQRVGFAAAAAVIFFVLVLFISLVQRRLITEQREV